MNIHAMRAKLDQYGTAVADFLSRLDDEDRGRIGGVLDAMVKGANKCVVLDPESAQLIGAFAKYGLHHAAIVCQDRTNNPQENDRGQDEE